MTPDEYQESVDRVRTDVVDGLRGLLAPRDGYDDGFELQTRFVESGPIANESFSTVVWRYHGSDVEGFAGAAPTGHPVEVDGVTLVDLSADPPLFHRYVDWNGVMAQLGFTASWRPVVPGPSDPAAMA